MALMEQRGRRALCGPIKRLFTTLTSQGQLVCGSLAWHREPEYSRINKENKGS